MQKQPKREKTTKQLKREKGHNNHQIKKEKKRSTPQNSILVRLRRGNIKETPLKDKLDESPLAGAGAVLLLGEHGERGGGQLKQAHEQAVLVAGGDVGGGLFHHVTFECGDGGGAEAVELAAQAASVRGDDAREEAAALDGARVVLVERGERADERADERGDAVEPAVRRVHELPAEQREGRHGLLADRGLARAQDHQQQKVKERRVKGHRRAVRHAQRQQQPEALLDRRQVVLAGRRR